MDIAHAQREMRTRFAGGFYGQAVSGLLWLASAALAGGGVAIALHWPASFAAAGWYTGVALIAFGIVGRAIVRREASTERARE